MPSGKFFMLFCRLLTFSKLTISKNTFRYTIRVSNSLNQDQARHFVGPDSGPNCLQRHQQMTLGDKVKCIQLLEVVQPFLLSLLINLNAKVLQQHIICFNFISPYIYNKMPRLFSYKNKFHCLIIRNQ